MQLIGGIFVNFFLTAPLFGSPGYLVNGAIYSQQIGLAVLIGLSISAMSVAAAIIAFPVFREHSLAMALWFVVLAGVGLAVSAAENIGMMSLVSFSEAYAIATGDERELLEAVRSIVSSARNWAHTLNLVFSGCILLVLYAVLYRFKLTPRILSGFGCAAVLLQLSSVSLPLFGNDVIFPMLAPLALSQIVLSLWLIVKGFNSSRSVEND